MPSTTNTWMDAPHQKTVRGIRMGANPTVLVNGNGTV
ncbi:Uncharacterised protein [Mycobacteroides abscessus subsp. abscessus]|nr:Uncharacterised protein [Mycobacteroides abscessus subsp. abscessus]